VGASAKGVHNECTFAEGPGHKKIAHIFNELGRPQADYDDAYQVEDQDGYVNNM